jgi:hypothetical protein
MIIRLADWRAMRRAQELRDALSSDPLVRNQARIRSLRAMVDAEQRARFPTLAPVVWLDTGKFEARWRERDMMAFFDLAARRDGKHD